MSESEVQRSVQLEVPLGVLNYRDVGGHATSDGRRVVQRRVFRSGDLSCANEADVAALKTRFLLRTVVDLRAPWERMRRGCAILARAGLDMYSLPLTNRRRGLGAVGIAGAGVPIEEGYLELLRDGAPSLVKLFRLLSVQKNQPLVFFCTAGKDRTGIVAAVLQSALGVPDSDIAVDYERSRECVDEQRRRSGITVYPGELPATAFYPRKETMLRFMAVVRREWSSPEGFLLVSGVPRALLAQVRDQLLI